MRELLRIENLSAGYGEAVVLSNVSLELAEGQALALLGRNGMGKTTLINTIVGVTRYFSGKIALAFACRPHVLLLDEPAAGVPEAERHELLATIAALPAEVTVLLIEHDMDLVFSFADRISVLVNGSLFVDGAPEDVARDPRVKAVYLGEELDA